MKLVAVIFYVQLKDERLKMTHQYFLLNHQKTSKGIYAQSIHCLKVDLSTLEDFKNHINQYLLLSFDKDGNFFISPVSFMLLPIFFYFLCSYSSLKFFMLFFLDKNLFFEVSNIVFVDCFLLS